MFLKEYFHLDLWNRLKIIVILRCRGAAGEPPGCLSLAGCDAAEHRRPLSVCSLFIFSRNVMRIAAPILKFTLLVQRKKIVIFCIWNKNIYGEKTITLGLDSDGKFQDFFFHFGRYYIISEIHNNRLQKVEVWQRSMNNI